MSNSLDTVDARTLLDMTFPNKNPVLQDDTNSIDALAMSFADQEDSDSVDTTTGAPFEVRAFVNAAQREDDRLTTLRKYYPDALPVEQRFENGADRFGQGNFVYTDPETGQLTLFDEDSRILGFPYPGLTDLTADIGPEFAEFVGGTSAGIGAAALAGTAASPTLLGAIPAATAAFVAGESLGSASARELYVETLAALGETEDSRTTSDQFIDWGSTATLNAFGGYVGSKILSGVNYFIGNPVRYVTGAMSKTARETFDRMRRAGVSAPTLGQITQNPMVNMMETFFRNVPTATKRMHENAAQTLNEIHTRVQELGKSIGGIKTPEEAGRTLKVGMGAAKERYTEKRNSLYNKVNEFINPNFSGNAASTKEFLLELNELKKNPMSASPVDPALVQVQLVMDAESKGMLTYDALKKFRSQIGRMVRQMETTFNGKLTDAEKHIQTLYGHLSKDLDDLVGQAARESGNEEAVKAAYKEANDFVLRNEANNLGAIDFINKVLKKGELDSVDALRAIMQNANQSGERIRRLKEALNPEEFDELSSYVLGNLGQAKGAVAQGMELGELVGAEGAEYVAAKGFDMGAFKRNWENLSLESKQLLFGDTSNKELIPAMDDLVFTIDKVKKAADSMANPSGTARVVNSIAMFGVAPTMMAQAGDAGLTYGLLGLGVPAGGSKLFTNPAVVKWLSTAIEKTAFDPQSMAQHVRRLGQIALVNPEIRDEIEGMLQRIQGETIIPIEEKKSASVREMSVPENNEGNFREVSTKEVADKLLPSSEELMSQMDQVTVPQVEGPLFEAETPDVNLAMSPTVLPRQDDRELALRLSGNAGGISGLV